MMNPLDALSALTHVGSPMSTGPAAPTGPANAVTENFNLLQPTGAEATTAPTGISAASGAALPPTTWGHMVHQMVLDVNTKQSDAASKVADVIKGGPTPVHEAMVATEEASLSFEMLAEMRNKLVDAYQQVMQMQV